MTAILKDYAELSKARIAAFVVLTTSMSFYLAGGQITVTSLFMLLGVALASMSTGSLNQYLERFSDALMKRTQNRPIPKGRINHERALYFGIACGALSMFILLFSANILSMGLTATTVGLYVLLYTPLKKITPQSTWIGCFSGAMPALIGWAAAQNKLSLAAWALFAIQFLWQIPHFLAIFWMHKEDYAAAGFKVMPVVDPSGKTTSVQIAIHALALLLATSILPWATNLGGRFYAVGSILLSVSFLGLSLWTSWRLNRSNARLLFLGSILYLPTLYSILIIDMSLV